jgi:hypothetical protein
MVGSIPQAREIFAERPVESNLNTQRHEFVWEQRPEREPVSIA